jgi:UDP-N-acetyl-D-glucosamine dehydrogenase
MADVKIPGYAPVAYQPTSYGGLQFEASSFAAHESISGAPTKETLIGKINMKEAVVGIVGLGYVGLPLAVVFAEAGYKVIGVDLSEEVVSAISRKISLVSDVPSERLARMVEKGKLVATTDYAALAAADCISICVPTPLTKSKEPDISYITGALDRLFPHLKKGMLVVLESTTYPGTTEELIGERIEKELHLKVGQDIFAVFSPERVDPGNTRWNTKNTPKVLGGITPACTEVGRMLYAAALDKVHTVHSSREAETVKLLENTFRAVNIGLVNEFMLMCDRLEIDIWSVIGAASTKPFGFMPFYPGPGIGGHCVSLDPLYLSWKAKAVDFYSRFIELATDINGNMPRFVLQKLTDILNDREKSLKGSKIMVLGMAYKKNVSDLRESPGLEVYRLLRQKGAWVEFFDPHATSFISVIGNTVSGTSIDDGALSRFDAAVLVTDHDAFDYKKIAAESSAILDCRNAFSARGITADHIVKL